MLIKIFFFFTLNLTVFLTAQAFASANADIPMKFVWDGENVAPSWGG